MYITSLGLNDVLFMPSIILIVKYTLLMGPSTSSTFPICCLFFR